jgi:hypothetical protein
VIKIAREERQTEGPDDLIFVNTSSAKKLAEIREATDDSSELSDTPGSFKTPFIGWTPETLYSFFKSHMRGPEDVIDTDNQFTHYTFLILDSQSLEDKSVLVCCNAPDFYENGDEIVLKQNRMDLRKATSSLAGFEFLTLAPSEWNSKMSISVMPPAILDTRGFEDQPGIVGKIATPAVARRNKWAALSGLNPAE